MAKRQKTARKATKKSKAAATRRSRSAKAGAGQENSRLKRELSEALERQKATGEILAAINNSTSELQPILDTIVQTASRLCGAEYALIFRLKDGKYHLAATNNATTTFIQYAASHPIAPGRSTLIGRTALERKTVHVPDCLADPEYSAFEYQRAGKYRSMLGVPLQQGGAPVGVIGLMRAAVKPFTERQIELVTTFANQAVIAIENARLFDEVKAKTDDLSESLQQQTATADVLKVISRSTLGSKPNLEAVLETLLESAIRLCGAMRGHVFRREGEFLRFVAASGAFPGFRDWLQENPLRLDRGSIAGRAALDRKFCHVHDVLADPEYRLQALHGFQSFRSVLAVPMVRGEELLGVIVILKSKVEPFTGKQIELVSTFADQAVIAFENVRLFEEVTSRTEDLRESLQQQTATADVLKVISRSTFDLQTVLDTLTESAARLCNADMATVARQDEAGFYYNVTNHNFPDDWIEYSKSFRMQPSRGGVVGRALLAGGPVQIADVLADPDYTYHEQQKRAGFRALLATPLLRGGSPIGVFLLGRKTAQPFDDKQMALVSTFADQAVIAIENVRLFDQVKARTEDLRESLQQQTATADVLKVISRAAFDLQIVLDTLVQSAAQLADAANCFIFRREGDKYRLASSHGFTPEYREWMEQQVIEPGRHTLVGKTALEGRTVHIPDVLADADYRWGESIRRGNFRTMLGIPLMREGMPIGVIAAVRPDPRPFTEKQIELITTFADQAVIAIENVRLFDEVNARTEDLRESLQQQTATADVLKVISRSTFDLQTVLDTLVESATHLCEADHAWVFQRDGDFLRFKSSFGHGTATHERIRELFLRREVPIDRGSIVGRSASEGRVVHVADVLADPEYTWSEAQKIGGYRAALGAPLLRDGKVVGVIFVAKTRPEPYSAKQIELVTTFADQAVIAIENVRLFEEVQARTRDLDESLQQQTATADVLKTISRSTFDLQTVLRTLVESAARLSDADKATITRQKGSEFYRAESFGFSDEFMDYVRTVPVKPDRGSATGRALLEGVVIHIPDVALDAEYTFSEAQRLGDFRSLLGVPMMREGVAVGVIVLTRAEPRPFTDKQIELVTTFADQAAIAIENVRLFEEVQQRTQELSRSLEELRAAQDRLIQTEKLASLGQLTAGIAHEIKNPLNFINNFSALSVELIDELGEVLAPAPLDASTREDADALSQMLKGNLEKVVQHGKRADSIVKNMLLHSREGSGDRRAVDINALVSESLNLAYHGARAEKRDFQIRLEQNLDPAAGEAEILPQEITRVLLNLISNAFYAAMKRRAENDVNSYEPALVAATRNLGDRVEIRIRDNGSGIPPDVKAKMFNPFFTTKPPGEGTGLGLSLSHDIVVKQHAGVIEVDTTPGEFTEFRVVLPRSAATGR